MVFNSLQYALFLPVVLAAYWMLRERRRQNLLLLVASYVFYGAWDSRFLALMWLSTGVDFFVGRALDRINDDNRRRRLFALSLVVNLGVLGFFKYFNFFTDSASQMLNSLGLQVNEPTLRILLPIGISFYTFHGISYTFDVYRRQIEPVRNLVDFACFVAYFPQLVAGPIGRAHIQLPQFQNPRTPPRAEQVRSGLFLILLGLVKKVAIADVMAPLVNDAFGASKTASALTLLVGMYAFALQIYGDFSGYSDIARGTSRLFGIELIRNFEQPYLARNPADFWHRWHISLSTWLRDYLYIPLGGNRGSEFRTYRNLLLTMVIGGLWHGAAWTFVAWGALHGLFLVVHRGFSRAVPAAPRVDDRWTLRRDLVPTLLTFHAVCVAWVFFRATTFTQAFDYLTGIVTLRGGGVDSNSLSLIVPAILVVLLIDLSQRNSGDHTPMIRWPSVPRGLAYGFSILAVVLFSGGAPVPFIYFQF